VCARTYIRVNRVTVILRTVHESKAGYSLTIFGQPLAATIYPVILDEPGERTTRGVVSGRMENTPPNVTTADRIIETGPFLARQSVIGD